MNKIVCPICPHKCALSPGQTGFCRARSNQGDIIIDDNYGKITAMALDPVEKKPLYHFYRGSKILSIGSFGCNLRCSFCQNYEISMTELKQTDTVYIPPEDLGNKAIELLPQGNIGVAFTYNEPLIGYEYVYDSAKILKDHGLKTVAVTNGYINEEPLSELLPLIDAMNIDLKGFSDDFYKKIAGHLEPVKKTIEQSHRKCHIEVTTLIVPGENDSENEIRDIAKWLASLDKNIPLHISRFFPRYQMTDRSPTPVETVYSLAETAREYLSYVYEGNC